MSFYASFINYEGFLFRMDTRIYLNENDHPNNNDRCIAAVIAKNPGSAIPQVLNGLAPLNLNGDRLLPYVRNRFLNSYRNMNLIIPNGVYIRVWNLFYICNPILQRAINDYNSIQNPPICPSEANPTPPILWFAWGSDPALNHLKERFLNIQINHSFYYNNANAAVEVGIPAINVNVRHTQGLPKIPIENHLATLI